MTQQQSHAHGQAATTTVKGSEDLLTLEGWFALHDFRKIDWDSWKLASEAERQQATEELLAFVRKFRANEDAKEGSTAMYTILGHKADLVFFFLRPSLQDLNDLENEFNKTTFADFTQPAYSYVSVVELSNYVHKPGDNPYENPHIKDRLFPTLPKAQHFCFYPMNKKREAADNWYMLTMEERSNLMKAHGLTGRKYAGKIKQIVTGSIGLDDWEWGVTLFADDPLQFKYIVTEMRYDEVSAKYGEFGNFLVGNLLDEEGIRKMLTV